nr:hypothetical protein [Salmonella enterica]
MAEKKPELQRGLEARHIELIALGGALLQIVGGDKLIIPFC